MTLQSDEKFGKLNCGTSLADWLESVEDPKILSNQKYSKNYKPLDIENPEIEIDFRYLQQGYNGEVVIQSQKGFVLFIGKISNRMLKGKIDPELVRHENY